MKTGDRVELHPATSLWMMGARFGTVKVVGRKWVMVELDATGKVRKFNPRNLTVID